MTSVIRFILFLAILYPLYSQEESGDRKGSLDARVKAFLEEKKGTWRDMNIPESDGKLLYDIILKNGYTRGLEIGTSTGHSGIWIAWALSKTGGKLITIEINKERHKKALENFKQAGLSEFIDARLADAHELVKELEGPFDFVFSDADKYWYTNYFKAIYPKLEINGCFTAHNVTGEGGYSMRGTAEFFKYVKSLKDMETTLDTSGNGLSISYKRDR
jgi:predicted O-methyltransferase YrrM